MEVVEATVEEQARQVLELLPCRCDREYWHCHTIPRVWDVIYRIHCKSGSRHAVQAYKSELKKLWGRGHPPQLWVVEDPESDEEPGPIEMPEKAKHNPMRFPVVD